MNVAIVVFSLIGMAEFLIGAFLFVVKQDVKYDMEWVKKGREQCFACQTGASVTSFDSRAKFCDHHLAHWVLITSLEKKTREELG